MAIAKVQAIILDHELKLADEKKKVEELEIVKHQVLKELTDHSSKSEALRTPLTLKSLLSDEDLRAQALADIEKACQKDIQHLRDQIKSLAEQG